jgi:hypothetical protein
MFITTTGLAPDLGSGIGAVILDDLGRRIFAHPTSGYELTSEYAAEELRVSKSLEDAFANNWLTAVDESANVIDETNLFQFGTGTGGGGGGLASAFTFVEADDTNTITASGADTLVITGTGNLTTSVVGGELSLTLSTGSGSGLDADTLDGISSEGFVQTTGNQTVAGDKNFTGTTTLDQTQIGDNEVILNFGEAGAGVTAVEAGIRIDRGTETDAVLHWDETAGEWQAGIDGSEVAISLEGHLIDTHGDVDTTSTPPTSNEVLQWNGTDNWVPSPIESLATFDWLFTRNLYTSNGQYLLQGEVPTNNTPAIIPFNCNLYRVIVKYRENATTVAPIDGTNLVLIDPTGPTTLLTVNTPSASTLTASDTDIDFSSGDELEIRVDHSAGGNDRPRGIILWLYFKVR